MLTVLAWMIMIPAAIWNLFVAWMLFWWWFCEDLPKFSFKEDFSRLAFGLTAFIFPAIYLFGVW